MFKNILASVAIVAFVSLALATVLGWFMNIQNLFTLSDPMTNYDILSVIGVAVAPIGAVMGWVH